MNGYENERELMYYLKVIWKRKWFILIATFLSVAAALVISFLSPSSGESYAIIQPSKFISLTKNGEFKEVSLVDPKLIAEQINKGFFNNLISSEIDMDIKKLPKFKAENITDTNLLWVSMKEKDIKKAKLFLNSLLEHLKREYDERAKFELNETNTQLNSKKKEDLRIKEDIKEYKNELNNIKKRKEYIEKEIDILIKRTEKLEKEQNLSLKEKESSELEYLITLVESLRNIIRDEENISLELKNKEKISNQLKKEINDLAERTERIYYAQIIKESISSSSPVSSKKFTDVLIAGILGLLIFGMLAFLLEYVEKQRLKLKK